MIKTLREYLDDQCLIILDTTAYLNVYERSPEFAEFSMTVL